MSGLPRRSSTRSDRRRSGSCYSDSNGPRPRERPSRRFEKPRATAASSANEREDLTATLETNERKTTTAAAVASCSIPRGADARQRRRLRLAALLRSSLSSARSGLRSTVSALSRLRSTVCALVPRFAVAATRSQYSTAAFVSSLSAIYGRSCKKPVPAGQTGQFRTAEIDRAAAQHRAAAFWDDDLRIFAQVVHDLLGPDQWPDALGISDVLAARARGRVKLPAVSAGVLRFRPGEDTIIADRLRQLPRGIEVLDRGIDPPGGTLVPGALSCLPPLLDDLANRLIEKLQRDAVFAPGVARSLDDVHAAQAERLVEQKQDPAVDRTIGLIGRVQQRADDAARDTRRALQRL